MNKKSLPLVYEFFALSHLATFYKCTKIDGIKQSLNYRVFFCIASIFGKFIGETLMPNSFSNL